MFVTDTYATSRRASLPWPSDMPSPKESKYSLHYESQHYAMKANTVATFFFTSNSAGCGPLGVLFLLLDLPGSVLLGLGLGPDGPASPLPIAMDPAGPGCAGIAVAHNITIVKVSL
ncbi:hypothetical protein LX32DRAFT_645504 [Colletotrichum zoysiae]|uniref:Uncharacterized protein n=1 Tax=Colletotrichum zoysiae TaxID=1216348 RepID=A0AAD9H4Z0_9PEZI|nr:hypothetical protein LX32DRAFT_645504 [Colletotrichum zoysiae]